MKKILLILLFLSFNSCSEKSELIEDDNEKRIVKCAYSESEGFDAQAYSFYEKQIVNKRLLTNKAFERSYASCEEYQKKYPKTFERKYDLSDLWEDRK